CLSVGTRLTLPRAGTLLILASWEVRALPAPVTAELRLAGKRFSKVKSRVLSNPMNPWAEIAPTTDSEMLQSFTNSFPSAASNLVLKLEKVISLKAKDL